MLDEELLKIMSGLFEGVPLHGAELVEEWRRRAAYTDALQRAMIEKHTVIGDAILSHVGQLTHLRPIVRKPLV